MQNNKILIIISCVDSYWVWRSLVARLNGVQEAGSSNLLTQTTFEETDTFVSVFLLCRVRRPLELRDAAALPCYSVALLLTTLLTQTTFEETDTEVSVFLFRPLELLEFLYNEKAPIARCFCFGLGFAYLPRTTYFVCNTSCALWLLGLSKYSSYKALT